jgi:AcrR family transcriptional regulator
MATAAEAANVSRQTAYNHFADRDTLVRALLTREVRSWLADCLNAIDYSLPSRELVVQATLIRLNAIERSPYYRAHLSGQSSLRVNRAIEESHHFYEVQREYWLPALSTVQERGDLRPGIKLGEVVHWLMSIVALFLSPWSAFTAIEARRHYLATFVVPSFVLEPSADAQQAQLATVAIALPSMNSTAPASASSAAAPVKAGPTGDKPVH